ncbi:IclR family transcriptional regulator [Leifsonia poae]|uniref:IclR family transcriptional regulator n=1 Tax=Leifsonia poae TaxID=110933 RepID=UPI001CBF1CC8|nr:IclR family transcriptional regulator [Leifsonia poae]
MSPEYTAPALDKSLDILELLAEQSAPLSQTTIAGLLGRSVGEIFRLLQTLERRGYVLRDEASGLYSLTMRLFDLAHRQPPLRALLQAAEDPMNRLADSVRQSCNLAVLDGGRLRVVLQVESPAEFGFHVRVGAAFPVGSTATGAVLAAFASERMRDDLLSAETIPSSRDELAQRMKLAVDQGHLEIADQRQPGIVDLALPVRSGEGRAVAALTVPYVATSFSELDPQAVLVQAEAAASLITSRLGAL